MFERFNQDARQVVVGAQEQARDLQHNYIGTEHLLLGLVAQSPDVPASRALRALGYTVESCRGGVERIVGRGSSVLMGHIPFTPRCKKVLELSLREALRLGHHYIGTEHLLLGILQEGGGVAAQILAAQGASFDAIRERVLALTAVAGREGAAGGSRTPAAEEVLGLATRIAAGAPVGSHHLLEALVRSDDSMAGRALAALGVDAAAVTDRIDEIDLTATTDVTPEQAAAGRMRMWVEGDELHLALADPETAQRVRQLAEGAGDELCGEGLLAGPFIGLHRALVDAVDGLDTIVRPRDDDEPGGRPAPPILERLRRRRSRP